MNMELEEVSWKGSLGLVRMLGQSPVVGSWTARRLSAWARKSERRFLARGKFIWSKYLSIVRASDLARKDHPFPG